MLPAGIDVQVTNSIPQQIFSGNKIERKYVLKMTSLKVTLKMSYFSLETNNLCFKELNEQLFDVEVNLAKRFQTLVSTTKC